MHALKEGGKKLTQSEEECLKVAYKSFNSLSNLNSGQMVA